ncbi:MAG: restriction endonuclease subunit S [Elusimicrobiota bacterium]|nr:restriction endonuclease subunit S [Elusimicrobiota bacterium]
MKLKDVCDEIENVSPAIEYKGQNFTYLDISSIDNSIHKIVEPKIYEAQNAPSRARQKIKIGDILLSTVRTYLKNTAPILEAYKFPIASTGFCVLRGKQGILESKFLFYKVLSDVFVKKLNSLQRGSSYPAVRNNDVLEQSILLPPLSFQQQIVQTIDKQFASANQMQKTVNKALSDASKLKQSILKKAFSGGLVSQNPKDEIIRRAYSASLPTKPKDEPVNALLEKLKNV